MSKTWMEMVLEERNWEDLDSNDHMDRAQEYLREVAQEQIDSPTYLRTITPPEMTMADLHLKAALVKRQR